MQPWERKHLTRAACAAAALACCALTWTHGATNQGSVELFAEVDVSFSPFTQLTASKVGGWGGRGRRGRETAISKADFSTCLQDGRLDRIEGEMKAYKTKLTSVLGEFHGLQARQSKLRWEGPPTHQVSPLSHLHVASPRRRVGSCHVAA